LDRPGGERTGAPPHIRGREANGDAPVLLEAVDGADHGTVFRDVDLRPVATMIIQNFVLIFTLPARTPTTAASRRLSNSIVFV